MSGAVRLVPLTRENVEAVGALDVAPAQRRFVASNLWTMAEALVHPGEAWLRVVVNGAEPVGFIAIHTPLREGTVYLWRMMIGARWQGRGFGSAALAQIRTELRSWPGVRGLRVSFVDAQGGPEAFYGRAGFRRTGRIVEGEVEAELAPL